MHKFLISLLTTVLLFTSSIGFTVTDPVDNQNQQERTLEVSTSSDKSQTSHSTSSLDSTVEEPEDSLADLERGKESNLQTDNLDRVEVTQANVAPEGRTPKEKAQVALALCSALTFWGSVVTLIVVSKTHEKELNAFFGINDTTIAYCNDSICTSSIDKCQRKYVFQKFLVFKDNDLAPLSELTCPSTTYNRYVCANPQEDERFVNNQYQDGLPICVSTDLQTAYQNYLKQHMNSTLSKRDDDELPELVE